MKLVAVLLLSLIVLTGEAQYYTVRGVIKDSSGNPVSRVTVQQEKYSSNGTSRKTDGSFTITVAKDQTIRSSCLGYGSFQYTVNADAILEIQLPVEPLVVSDHGIIQPGIKKGRIIFEILSQSFIIPPVQIIKYLRERELIEDENRIFEKVEVPPAYRGGMNALCRHLAKTVTTKKEGRIRLKFFIDWGGYTSNVQVLLSRDKAFDTEIVSAFSKLTWVPAIQNGPGYGVWCTIDLIVAHDKGETLVTLR